MQPKTIHYILIATGACALIISIMAGLQFYVSLGYSLGGQLVYGFTGVIIAICCAVMLPVVIGLWQNSHVVSAVFFSLVWIILSALQIYSEFGFFAKEQSNLESARSIASDSYKTVKQRYDSLSQYSSLSVDALNSQKDSLEKQILSNEEILNSLPANFKSKRKEQTKEINTLRDRLASVNAQIANAQNYASAKNEFENAAKPSNGAAKMGEFLHAAYQWGETLTGIKAHTLQVYTSVTIAVFLELWASLSAFLTMKLFGGNHSKQWDNYKSHLEMQHNHSQIAMAGFNDLASINLLDNSNKPVKEKIDASGNNSLGKPLEETNGLTTGKL